MRKERVGGGRTNHSVGCVQPLQGTAGSTRPSSAPVGRASTPASDGLPSKPSNTAFVEHTPSAPQSVVGFEGTPQNEWCTAGSARDSNRTARIKRTKLFSSVSTAGSAHQADDRHGSQSSSRPGTVTRRVSRSGGDGKALARPISAPSMRTAPVPSRPGTGTSISSETSDQVEERCLQFQKMFQCKNLTKFKKLKDAFRNVDVDKNGVLGPDEVAEAMASLDIPVDKRLVDHLMSRCDDHTSMSLMDFKVLPRDVMCACESSCGHV